MHYALHMGLKLLYVLGTDVLYLFITFEWIDLYSIIDNACSFYIVLRHTNASLQILNSVNILTVAGRLGHSSVATTTKTYAHAMRTAEAIAIAKLESVVPIDPGSVLEDSSDSSNKKNSDS